MTELLEFKDKLKLFYSRNEIFITPFLKFVLAFLVFNTINAKMGYMTKIDNVAVVLIIALMCSFLPNGAMVFLAAVFSLAHMYALALEVSLVGVCAYVLLFLVFLRLSPRDSIVVLVTPLLFLYKIPFVIPVVMGLMGGPVGVIAVGCGVFIYFFLATITENAAAINAMTDADILSKVRLLIDSILGNRQMVVIIISFAITLVVVYLLRRMSIDYSWTIAIIAGAIVDVLLLLVGDLLYDTNMSVVNVIIGAVVTVAVAKIIEFFEFFVDYNRTERVQFEDDEYYYYVKAVPKISVSAQTRTVKKINAQRERTRETVTGRTGSRTGTAGRTDAVRRGQERNAPERNQRNVESDDDIEELF